MIIGHLRVSTGGQTIENQRLAIYDAGFSPDEWYEISASSRVSNQKRRLDELMEKLSAGDTLIVTELSRLGRSVGQIAVLVDEMVKSKIRLHCLKENIKLDGTGTRDLQTKVMLTMFSLFAEIERDLISERTKEGIERARKQGKQIGRPKGIGSSKLDLYHAQIAEWLQIGLNVSAISKLTGVGYTTVRHYIKTRL